MIGEGPLVAMVVFPLLPAARNGLAGNVAGISASRCSRGNMPEAQAKHGGGTERPCLAMPPPAAGRLIRRPPFSLRAAFLTSQSYLGTVHRSCVMSCPSIPRFLHVLEDFPNGAAFRKTDE